MDGGPRYQLGRMAGGPLSQNCTGPATCGGLRRGDVVIIHSIPTTSVGIHVNCCQATLLALATLNMLGDECWVVLLHEGNLALASGGGGRIFLPLQTILRFKIRLTIP